MCANRVCVDNWRREEEGLQKREATTIKELTVHGNGYSIIPRSTETWTDAELMQREKAKTAGWKTECRRARISMSSKHLSGLGCMGLSYLLETLDTDACGRESDEHERERKREVSMCVNSSESACSFEIRDINMHIS